jgi:hypothetical protein
VQADDVIVTVRQAKPYQHLATGMVTVSGCGQVIIDHAEGAAICSSSMVSMATVATLPRCRQINLTIDGGAGNDTIIGSARRPVERRRRQ